MKDIDKLKPLFYDYAPIDDLDPMSLGHIESSLKNYGYSGLPDNFINFMFNFVGKASEDLSFKSDNVYLDEKRLGWILHFFPEQDYPQSIQSALDLLQYRGIDNVENYLPFAANEQDYWCLDFCDDIATLEVILFHYDEARLEPYKIQSTGLEFEPFIDVLFEATGR